MSYFVKKSKDCDAVQYWLLIKKECNKIRLCYHSANSLRYIVMNAQGNIYNIGPYTVLKQTNFKINPRSSIHIQFVIDIWYKKQVSNC